MNLVFSTNISETKAAKHLHSLFYKKPQVKNRGRFTLQIKSFQEHSFNKLNNYNHGRKIVDKVTKLCKIYFYGIFYSSFFATFR